VKRVVEELMPEKGVIELATEPTDDVRSYHINSDKIERGLGFTPKYTVEDAVRDLVGAFRAGKLPHSMEDDRYYNVRTLKKLKAA
jgi:nucleoside-diphosphate-sugar epimerase